MLVSVSHSLAVGYLRSSSFVFARDFVDGDCLICVGDARRVLGMSMRIPKSLQVLFLNELCLSGCLEFVDKKVIRLLYDEDG